MDHKRTALPLQNSQYWGAALNNYLRHIDTNIAGLEEQMNNFKIATSYDGSGFVEKYNLSVRVNSGGTSNWVIDGNGNLSCKATNNDLANLVLVLQGGVFFTGTGNRKSDTFTFTDSSAYVNIHFTTGSDGDEYYCKYITKNESLSTDERPSYTVTSGSFANVLPTLVASRNYFPLYLHRRPLATDDPEIKEQEGNQIEIVVGTYGYVYDSDYILFGVLEAFQSSGTWSLKIIKKYDSSSKSVYETRRDNRESYATLLSSSRLYSTNPDGSMSMNFGSANYIISTNGINTTAYTMTSNEVVRDLDSKVLYPLGNGNNLPHYLIIVKDQNANDTENIVLCDMSKKSSFKLGYDKTTDKAFSDEDGTNSILIDTTPNHHRLYGVYATISGEFIIEWSPVNADVNSYNWRLPKDSNFDCGGLVFLGCFYLVEADSNVGYTWSWADSTTQGVKPTILSNNGIETTEFINLNAVHYFYTLADKTNPSFQWQLDNAPAAGTNLHFKFPDNTTTAFYIPLFKSTEFTYTSDSLQLRGLTITSNSISVAGNITATGNVSGVDASFSGNIVLGEADKTITLKSPTTVQGDISAGTHTVSGNLGKFGKLNLSGSKIEYIDGETTKYKVELGDNKITFNDYLEISQADSIVTIKATNNTLALEGKSDTSIQLRNNLNFTSDVRCKHDIRKVDDKVCYEAIKNMDVDLYKYIGQNRDNIGIIAQDLEKYLPQYKDVLIDIINDGTLKDKRTVSEIKLLFVVWSAVKHLISKIEGSDK